MSEKVRRVEGKEAGNCQTFKPYRSSTLNNASDNILIPIKMILNIYLLVKHINPAISLAYNFLDSYMYHIAPRAMFI